MTDFFISYTAVDEAWAEWIGYALEEEGFSIIMQSWDFRPGSNFVLEMQNAAQAADRTILVLSPDYLQSQFAAPEGVLSGYTRVTGDALGTAAWITGLRQFRSHLARPRRRYPEQHGAGRR